MKYVSPEYKQRLDDLAQALVVGRYAVTAPMPSEDQQVQDSIDRTRAECVAEEEQRLGVFRLAEVVPFPDRTAPPDIVA